MNNCDFIATAIDNSFVFDQKELDMLENNKKFYTSNPEHVNILLSIINGKSIISLRIIDWFIYNFAKKNDICYGMKYNVFDEYQNLMTGYGKRYFDLFCRGNNKIMIHYKTVNNDINFITSIGQLNFFRWAIKNKIIHYVIENVDIIENDMKEAYKYNQIRAPILVQ